MVVGFLLAVGCALLLTHFVRHHARRVGLFDHPDERKVHIDPVPRIGGIAIAVAYTSSLAVLIAISGRSALGIDAPLLALLGGAISMHFWGIYDDLHPMRARFKLAGQLFIASVTFAAGLRVPGIALPLLAPIAFEPAASAIFTVLWLIAITNAFNLIDGMDGLAGGVAVIALAAFCVIGTTFLREGAALLSVVLAGATLGFLRYNFHPATIFLGDSGSLFLGFMLAGLSLTSAQSSAGSVAIAIPLLILGIPVFDTGVTIVRRFLRGDGIFQPDRGHLHHRLLDKGLGTRSVALLLHGLAACLALIGIVVARDARLAAALVAFCVVSSLFLMHALRFYEFEELSNVIVRGKDQRRVIGRSVRFREAAGRLAELHDLRGVFRMLEQVFDADGASQVELRMRREFTRKWLDPHTIGRADDDLIVWSWTRHGGPSLNCWEIVLPLTSPDCERIGSLVVWEEAESGASLSHLRAVRQHLGLELQRKLCMLRRASMSTPITSVGGPALERSARWRSAHRTPDDHIGVDTESSVGNTREPVLADEA